MIGSVVSLAGVTAADEQAGLLPAGQVDRDMRRYLLRYAPDFLPPGDPHEWRKREADLRGKILEQIVFRGTPAAWRDGGVRVRWQGELEGDGYKIRKLIYEVVPGLWAGGLLYEPTEIDAPVPAVLNPNGHVGAPGMTIDYKQIRCLNLVKRGMIALNLEWIGMGQLQQSGLNHNHLVHLDLCGQSGLAVFYLSLTRALDILCQHQHVDQSKIAVTGLSGGGWQTLLVSALDPRVSLAAPNAGYIGVKRRIWNGRDIGDAEQLPTDMMTIADYPDLTALLAPRPALLIYNATDDCCFKAAHARLSVYEPVTDIYQMLGAAASFDLHINEDPGTHNYLLDNRQAFYHFLNRHFLPESQWQDEEIDVGDEIQPASTLAIDYPEDNATFLSLASDAMKELPRKVDESDTRLSPLLARRLMLRKIVHPDTVPPIQPEHLREADVALPGLENVEVSTYQLRIPQRWTLPVICCGETDNAAKVTILLDDRGCIAAVKELDESLCKQNVVMAADILFVGECQPRDVPSWRYAILTASLGRRSLGIQVGQIEALVRYAAQRYPDAEITLHTNGRMTGLAGLVFAALYPGRLESLEMDDMIDSLKTLIRERVRLKHAPSMFCFGLLEAVDIDQLEQLAAPTRVVRGAR
jgi:hypothetical protein